LAPEVGALADSGKFGTEWDTEALDFIIADYFAMLSDDLAGRPYVKAQHRAVLLKQLGRSKGSVEYKYRNISAVLHELGLPWISGYKPAFNFQKAMFGVIERRLLAERAIVYAEPAPTAPASLAEAGAVFVGMPPPTPQQRPRELEQLIQKFDPVERDRLNRALGFAGEGFVMEIEKNKLTSANRHDLAKRIRWVSQEDGDGAGYDILSYEASGAEKLIEVKTTNGAAKTPFFLTRREYEVADCRRDDWHLYRVHLFAQKPRIFTVRPPLPASLHLQTETWRASIA